MISVASGLPDLEYTKKRLLRNPIDIANLYREFYSAEVANKIQNFLNEYLVIGGDLIVALKNNEVEKVVLIMARYFTNGILEQFAGLFLKFYEYFERQHNKISNVQLFLRGDRV